MANIFFFFFMAKMVNMPGDHVYVILNGSAAFSNNEIDRNLAIKLFDKFSKKTPKEINQMLKFVDENF